MGCNSTIFTLTFSHKKRKEKQETHGRRGCSRYADTHRTVCKGFSFTHHLIFLSAHLVCKIVFFVVQIRRYTYKRPYFYLCQHINLSVVQINLCLYAKNWEPSDTHSLETCSSRLNPFFMHYICYFLEYLRCLSFLAVSKIAPELHIFLSKKS